ncbi:aminoacyl tRNA synthase complex-interacting multifunctional protein 1-like [Xiphophorus maculatus]|uniref:aminoacyl tRNA synthase complex-interacting multifunctional protein 1-like n=1 Tax=Xiphophorus maculatus TaxID=8083 RepID=UPI000C6DE404|nr:aminoacyl tRNA synthase complex-interacting multifunctional protein 1-like [Xiphophorus maculatus]
MRSRGVKTFARRRSSCSLSSLCSMKYDGADGGRQLTEGGPEAKPLGSTRVLQRSQPSVNMDNMENLFNPSLAAALKKLDPEDGEQIMEYFKTHALLSREKALLQASVREQKKLLVENAKLKKDIDQLRGQLQDKQKRRTAKALFSQAPPPHRVSPAHCTPDPTSPSAPAAAVPSCCPPPSVSSGESRDRAGRRRRAERKARPVSDPLSLGAESRIDASRLDLRVGRILSVRRHPLAEAMSVQDVDVGENSPRTVVSKLGGLQDLDQAMQFQQDRKKADPSCTTPKKTP